MSAISDLGIGNENKIAMRFERVFWPNVEFLGVVANTSYACGYFLNLHKATGHPVLVYMAAGALANDLEKLSDEAAADFVMLQLKRMFPDAGNPVSILFVTVSNFVRCVSDVRFRMVGDRSSILYLVGEQIQTFLDATRTTQLGIQTTYMTGFAPQWGIFSSAVKQ